MAENERFSLATRDWWELVFAFRGSFHQWLVHISKRSHLKTSGLVVFEVIVSILYSIFGVAMASGERRFNV